VIDRTRLQEPADDFAAAFPDLNFCNRWSFVTNGEPILLIDPIYLADVYNSHDELASYLRDRAIFLMDFGGDTGGPVWWMQPYLLLPISMHHTNDDLKAPAEAEVLCEKIVCDSGSFMFLPVSRDLPSTILTPIENCVEQENAALLRLPSGQWRAYYEQFNAPQSNMVSLYRNIVLQHSPLVGG
jgi:hypothetical protein